MKNSQWVLSGILITLFAPALYSILTGYWLDIISRDPNSLWEWYLGITGLPVAGRMIAAILALTVVGVVWFFLYCWEQIEKLDD